jgi:hypothetical protein
MKANKNQQRNRIIFIIVIIAILACVLAYSKYNSNKVIVEDTVKEDTVKDTKTPEIIKISSTNKKISEDSKYYTLSAEYPVIAGLADKSILKKINDKIKNEVDSRIQEFKDSASDADSYEADMGKNELTIGVNSYSISHGIINISMRVSDFQSGSAHPESYGYTQNFNTKNGEILDFKDLFKKDSKYLDLVSKKTIEQLKKNLKPDDSGLIWIKSGASANPDNYVDFQVKENALAIFFNPYQVAPYTSGIVKIEIPLSDLSSVIDL